ncbi:hypothetical protein SAMN04487931_10352 [Desulfobacula phenolica]|uniref:Uncharacterized protein n=1 Tax=Desulfobacula phenolica TaxID=90732 RepID=A0A1H2EEK7_9BACT|nr:hypothetical protein SAMN04487931_10352 [Desulfobacula phenolica]
MNTEIAVENKKRRIREAKIEADRAVQEKRLLMKQDDIKSKITLDRICVSKSGKECRQDRQFEHFFGTSGRADHPRNGTKRLSNRIIRSGPQVANRPCTGSNLYRINLVSDKP